MLVLLLLLALSFWRWLISLCFVPPVFGEESGSGLTGTILDPIFPVCFWLKDASWLETVENFSGDPVHSFSFFSAALFGSIILVRQNTGRERSFFDNSLHWTAWDRILWANAKVLRHCLSHWKRQLWQKYCLYSIAIVIRWTEPTSMVCVSVCRRRMDKDSWERLIGKILFSTYSSDRQEEIASHVGCQAPQLWRSFWRRSGTPRKMRMLLQACQETCWNLRNPSDKRGV